MNLTTGNSLNQHDQYTQNYIDETMALLGIFIEDSTHIASLYCTHAGRNIITKHDIELALKTRAYYGDIFWTQSGIQQRIAEMKQSLREENYEGDDEDDNDDNNNENDDDEDDDDEMDINDDEENEEVFVPSSCTCESCVILNDIREKW